MLPGAKTPPQPQAILYLACWPRRFSWNWKMPSENSHRMTNLHKLVIWNLQGAYRVSNCASVNMLIHLEGKTLDIVHRILPTATLSVQKIAMARLAHCIFFFFFQPAHNRFSRRNAGEMVALLCNSTVDLCVWYHR